MARVLGRVRLSRFTDESTSPERQREIIQQWSDLNGHQVVGWAVDMDVSRSVNPFDTPALGPWLTDAKQAQWDIVAGWKLDRIATGSIYLNKVVDWCDKYGKSLVSVTENFDLSTWVGRLIANVIAGVAEGELEAIRERTQGSRKKLVASGRWFGGKPPYGYRAVKQRTGEGWKLEPDPESSVVLERIVDQVIAGDSALAVSKQLTAEKVLTPSDFIRYRNKKPTRGTSWNPTTLLDLLRSKSLLGYMIHDGIVAREDDGTPVMVGTPLLSVEKFGQLQGALEQRAIVQQNERGDASPLLEVAKCFDCQNNLYHQRVYDNRNGNRRRYYRCQNKCTQQIVADTAELLVEERFLGELGHVEVFERVYIPAQDHQAELVQAVEAMDELTTLLRGVKSQAGRQRLSAQIAGLDSQIQELERMPASEAREELRPTGKTYSEVWQDSDVQERRALLIQAGIVAKMKLSGRVGRSGGALQCELFVPEDVRQRMN
ncbi:recombinase family protein [Nocardia alni]|uniref:recombinase family protein n=1 Tax=Nocardia alni TaxID=2815723 RepID=UPI001C2337E9|nr:recombinase family protein [Nocardia alni]